MADITIQVASNSAVSAPKSSIAITAGKAGSATATKKSEPSKNKGFQDIISTSKDGDTASASPKSKAMLEENGQDNESSEIIKNQAKNRAQRARNMLNTQLANEELQNDMTGEATIQAGKVKTEKHNPYIESIKNELAEEIRDAEAAIEDGSSEQKLQNIEIKEQKAINEAASKARDAEQTNDTRQNAQGVAMDDSESEFQAVSFDGYSDQQLRKLYLNGTISRYNYEQEMSSRAEENREFEEREQVFREGIVRNIDDREQTQRTSEVINNVLSDDSSDTLSAEQRLEMLDAAELETENV